ncbi:MlaD family protein [Aquihabitans daechungensis]|uniref:MlaD family protein n=1 Tax=Aquihabitans daechungensis TaxID=1052257 RepID=UPI003B9FD3FC
MIDRRIIANLIVFFTLSGLLIAYGAVTLFGNPFEQRRTVAADLPDAGGLRTGFSASHDGVVIGTVSKIDLHGTKVRVTVELDPGVTVPSGVEAKVVRASAVGEQRLDLASTGATSGKALPDGAVVPVADDPIPPDVADVLETTNRLFAALPADDLNILVRELATSVDGRAGDLQAINRAIGDINEDVIAVEPDLEALLADAPGVLDDFSAMSPSAHRALRNTEILSRTLASRDEDIVQLLVDGGDLAETFDRVLLDDRASLTCVIGDVRTINHALQGETLDHLDQGLALNALFFGAIDDVAVRGDAADVGYGPAQDDALWLRSRLLVPPESPPGSRYSPPRGPRPVQTGAGCRNAYGTGADAVEASDTVGDELASTVRPGVADRSTAPGDARPEFPPGRPIDDSPGAQDRPTNFDLVLLLGGLIALAAAAAKSYTYLRNRSVR